MFYWFLKWAVGHIDRKVVVSKDALELVQSHLGGEYDILFNGVEIDEIASAPPTPTSRPTIFFCGRHEERKGLAVLLEAFTTLADDVHLWIASDGPDGPRLRQQYAGHDRITWLGRISDAEKFARLRGATVFCAPSLHGESFGVVLDRGDGGGDAGRGERHRRLPQRGDRRRRRRARRAGRRRRSRRGARPASSATGAGRLAAHRRPHGGRGTSRCAPSPPNTSASTANS